MIRARYSLALLACVSALSVALASCGGGGGSQGRAAGLPGAVPPTAGSGASRAATFDWGSDAMNGAAYVGPAHFAAMGVNVGLRLQNAAGLVAYAQSVSNPHSALYRRFLTPAQIGAQFGASSNDYAAAAKYFSGYGLHVGGWPQHLMLYVAGTQSELENAFHTTFGVYRSSTGSTFIAPSSAPSFGERLAVTMVGNLMTQTAQERQFVPVRAGNADIGGYSPAQLRNVFDYTGAYAAGYTGTGINIGIIGTGPISPADVPAFASMFHVQAAPVEQVDATDQGVASGLGLNSPQPNPSATPPYTFPYNEGLATPPPATAPCNGPLPSCNPEDIEAQIDTEQAATLAPGSNVLFYLAYNPGECFQAGGAVASGSPCPGASGATSQPAIGLSLSDDEIQQAIADDTADILSLSYGGPELSDPAGGQYGAAGYYFDPNDPTGGFGPAEFAALAAEGIAVFVSSGDRGAETCKGGAAALIDSLCVSYPASDPNVVAVGGVTTPMNQFGQLTNQITAWGVQTNAGLGGSGGGVSAYFQQPSFQTGISGVQGATRNLPDIALEADPATGVTVLVNASLGGPETVAEGGTSVAAPEMAAMWALVLQACKQSSSCSARGTGTHPYRLGDPNGLLYPLYYANGTVQPTYASTFYDVVFGNNALVSGPVPIVGPSLDPGYNAGVGYDLVTGLGVPFADHLINAILATESHS